LAKIFSLVLKAILLESCLKVLLKELEKLHGRANVAVDNEKLVDKSAAEGFPRKQNIFFRNYEIP
jgi:hypothetical protein